MKVLIYSAFAEKENRNTSILLKEVCRQLLINNSNFTVMTPDDITEECNGCMSCVKTRGTCRIKDKFPNIEQFDSIIIITPIYFFSLPCSVKKFVDRLYPYNLKGKVFAPILISGSQFYDGGADLIIEMFRRIDSFCGSITVTPYNKVTFDALLPLYEQDRLGIQSILQNAEVATHGN